MNWVAVALCAPVVILGLFEPSIFLWLGGFVLFLYIPCWWLMEKVIGEKRAKEDNRDIK